MCKKVLFALASCLFVGLLLAANVLADRAILHVFRAHEGSAQDLSADILGAAANEALTSVDPTHILLNGQPLSDTQRGAWAANPDAYTATCTDAAVGQAVQLYTSDGLCGTAQVTAIAYDYEASSGSDHLTLALRAAAPLPSFDKEIFGIAEDSPHNPAPRPITASDDGTVFTLSTDIEGDRQQEVLTWDRAAPAGDEGTRHPITVGRDGSTPSELSFFYDNDYTKPIPPSLMDLDGDGTYELLLAGNGHNRYVRVLRWDKDAFVPTDVKSYSGD